MSSIAVMTVAKEGTRVSWWLYCFEIGMSRVCFVSIRYSNYSCFHIIRPFSSGFGCSVTSFSRLRNYSRWECYCFQALLFIVFYLCFFTELETPGPFHLFIVIANRNFTYLYLLYFILYHILILPCNFGKRFSFFCSDLQSLMRHLESYTNYLEKIKED
jgi:hypothetical protein